MSYFGFLGIFVVVPIVILALILRFKLPTQPKTFHSLPPRWVIAAIVVVAVVYTTPWDNYLVATRVWWYDPELVTGIVFGWVPIEEYSFFVLQTLLTGFLLLVLMRLGFGRTPTPPTDRPSIRKIALSLLTPFWLIFVVLLFSGYAPTTYLSLELSWALIPIGIQLAWGADILWHYRKLVFWAIVPITLYLAGTDAIAIESGTWTIDPAQSTGIMLGGVLPIEEFIFFLITNILVVFGVTLVLSDFSYARFTAMLAWLRNTQAGKATLHFLQRRQVTFSPAMWRATALFLTWLFVMTIVPHLGWWVSESALIKGVVAGTVAQTIAVIAFLRLTWSWQKIGAIVIAIATFTLIVEAVGTRTGFPFGGYHYTSQLQPQLFNVPLLIPVAWFILLPSCWVVARRWQHNRWQFAAVSALAMTAWDLMLDPQMVNWNLWVWDNPQGFFGIPWTNFLGWLGTAFLLSALLYPMVVDDDLGNAAAVHNRRFALLAVYAAAWLMEVVGLGLFWGLPGPALIGGAAMGVLLFIGWRGLDGGLSAEINPNLQQSTYSTD